MNWLQTKQRGKCNEDYNQLKIKFIEFLEKIWKSFKIKKSFLFKRRIQEKTSGILPKNY